MMKKKTVLLMVSLALSLAPLFGGGQSGGGGGGGAKIPPTGTPSLATGKISYPIETGATLTYWAPINVNLAPNYPNFGEVPFYKGWTERTGIKVTYLHPPTGGENEQFNLIVASGELPDIMLWNFVTTYPGGPEKAINDRVILKLNDLINNYAPNLKEVLNRNPEYDRMIKTDNGIYYNFPNIRSDVGLCIWQGLQVRKDWLDELGLQVPVTYDDWHTMLSAFKTGKNSPAPLAVPFDNADFMYGFGFNKDFYIGNDGKVHWGRAEPAFRDYLALMAQWYREGLLDPDMATLTNQQVVSKITGGTAGAVHGALNSGMGIWLPSGRTTNPKFELLAVKNPVLRRSDELAIIDIDMPYSGGNGSVSISGTSKNPEIAARFLDWGYSREGYMYHNFGIEGVSYNMINGYPTYTDLLMKDPNGWPIGQSISAYVMAAYGGPHIQAIEYWQQALAFPEQKAAIVNWAIDEPFKHKIPSVTPTPDESQESARIMAEVNTYADEMLVKFILGTEPLSNFDTYVSTIKRMGIDRAVEIQNAALARYNAR
jgi:putative aldouronate transport system substrate-binding protein